jgi:iron complex transport system substrate-binding protein
MAGVAFAAPAFVVPQGAMAADMPQRIVSINLCTDQLLLALDLEKQLAAVSFLARDRDLSVMWREAQHVPITHASLEGILTLQPDLVIAGAFGHSRLLGHVERLGIDVLRVSDPVTLADIRQSYLDVGARVGASEAAEQIAAEIDDVLGTSARDTDVSALILSPGLLVHADGMLGGSVLAHAGYRNDAGGQTYLSLERLALSPPDVLLIAERPDAAPSRAGKLFAHPALQQASRIKRVPPSALICGTTKTARLAAVLADDLRREVGR